MRKSIIKSTLIGGVVLGALTACTNGYLDMNTNPYEVTEEEMQRDGYLVSSSLTGMEGWIIPTDVNTNQFTETLAGGPFAGYIAESNAGFGNRFSNFNQSNGWNRVIYKDIIPKIYGNMTQLKGVTTNPIYLSVATIIKVAALHRVTDAYGPIPYTKLGADGNLTAPLDPQKTVYEAMIKELTEAVAVLLEHKTEDFTPNADKIFNGNVIKWIKYGNSLKLRLGMRMVYADPVKAKEVCEAAVNPANGGVMDGNDCTATMVVSNNPFRVIMYEYNGGDARIAADLTSYMNGYNDPRRAAMYSETTFEKDGVKNGYYGIRIGTDAIPNDDAHAYSNMVVGKLDNLLVMPAAETQFLMAEGALRGWNMGGGTAKSYYEAGVQMSFEQWGAGSASAYLADNTSLPEIYIDPLGTWSYNGTQPTVTIAYDESADTETNLERIITQKWIAMFPNGNEGWAEFRRTGYPRLMPTAVDKNSAQVPAGQFARRLWYPDEEKKDNAANVAEAIKDLTPAVDLMSSRMWWDCNPNTK